MATKKATTTVDTTEEVQFIEEVATEKAATTEQTIEETPVIEPAVQQGYPSRDFNRTSTQA